MKIEPSNANVSSDAGHKNRWNEPRGIVDAIGTRYAPSGVLNAIAYAAPVVKIADVDLLFIIF